MNATSTKRSEIKHNDGYDKYLLIGAAPEKKKSGSRKSSVVIVLGEGLA